jgi:hypothetical protein
LILPGFYYSQKALFTSPAPVFVPNRQTCQSAEALKGNSPYNLLIVPVYKIYGQKAWSCKRYLIPAGSWLWAERANDQQMQKTGNLAVSWIVNRQLFV